MLRSRLPDEYVARDDLSRVEKGKTLAARDRRLTVRGAFHGLIATLGWILFVYWWHLVIPQVTGHEAFAALVFIGAAFLVTVAVTLSWVSYNIGIFRRKGPRKAVPDVSESRDADVLGRMIDRPADGSLLQARVIVIAVDGDRKKIAPGGIA